MCELNRMRFISNRWY